MSNLNIDNETFVRALYKTIFHKDNPDLEGVNWWVNDLNNGATHEQVAYNFIQHPQWAQEHSVFPENLDGYIARNHEIIDMAWMNTFNTHPTNDVINHLSILMFDGVPTQAILTAIAEASVIGQNVEHPFWWGF